MGLFSGTITPTIQLRDYQCEALNAVQNAFNEYHKVLLVAPTGCHASGTPILMFDGSIVPVETIKVGDQLMGPDSTPRTVMQLCRGRQEMYRITPIKGEPFIVNKDHILSLKRTNGTKQKNLPLFDDVKVSDYLEWNKYRKHVYKLYRCGVDFKTTTSLPPIDPHFLGVYIGDGSSINGSVNVTTPDREIVNEIEFFTAWHGLRVRKEELKNNKASTYYASAERKDCGRGRHPNEIANILSALGLHKLHGRDKFIPSAYKYGSRATRFGVLAGLLDTDGYHDGCGGFQYSSASKRLANDVVFVSRSIGLAAYIKTKIVNGVTYWIVSISGNTHDIPTTISRKKAPKRKQIKNVLVTGFNIEPVGEDDFFGFVLDGDHRYLMGDFTVCHNSGKTVMFASAALRYWNERKAKTLILAHREELLEQAADKIFRTTGLEAEIEKAESEASPDAPVVVASVQTLMREKRRCNWPTDHFGLIVIDECFVSGTKVDGTPIELIKVGDTVNAYHHSSKMIIRRKVTKVFKSKPSSLMKLNLSNGTQLICTPGHPIYIINKGYVQAACFLGGNHGELAETSDVLLVLRGISSRKEEKTSTEYVRVDSATLLKSTSDGTFGGLCPDGYVYNLEVENEHNYFANNVLVHNCHHSLADSYQNTLNYFAGEGSHTHVLGVTATPDRGDKKNLGKYFQTIAHEIQLVDLIKAGYLSKINIKTMPIKIDLSGVRTVAGDYDANDLGDHLGRYLREIAKSISEHAVMRKVLVFLPLICTSQAFVKVCNEIGLTAAHVDGNSPDREQILRDYANGKYDVLSNAMLLTEGYDCPLIDCVVPLRPTKVRALYSQMVGRGTRIATGKSNLLLLDFLWLHEEHDLIKPAHLIAQTEHIAQKMGSLQGDDEIDIEELQQRAIGQIEEELQAESEARQQRENKLKEQLKANAGRERKLIDAVDFFTSLHDVTDAEYEPTMPWEYDPPSDKQLQSIARMGINPESITCKGHASRILDRVFTRRKLNLATPKQVAYLKKMGHPSPENATFDEAKAFLDSMFNRPKFARIG